VEDDLPELKTNVLMEIIQIVTMTELVEPHQQIQKKKSLSKLTEVQK
jgi:hypothetical protein